MSNIFCVTGPCGAAYKSKNTLLFSLNANVSKIDTARIRHIERLLKDTQKDNFYELLGATLLYNGWFPSTTKNPMADVIKAVKKLHILGTTGNIFVDCSVFDQTGQKLSDVKINYTTQNTDVTTALERVQKIAKEIYNINLSSYASYIDKTPKPTNDKDQIKLVLSMKYYNKYYSEKQLSQTTDIQAIDANFSQMCVDIAKLYIAILRDENYTSKVEKHKDLEQFMRIFQDICKVVHVLKANPELYRQVQILENSEKLHAEINLITKVVQDIIRENYGVEPSEIMDKIRSELKYIGISKPCCAACQNILNFLGIGHRGGHATFDEWNEPQNLLDILQALGQNLRLNYNHDAKKMNSTEVSVTTLHRQISNNTDAFDLDALIASVPKIPTEVKQETLEDLQAAWSSFCENTTKLTHLSPTIERKKDDEDDEEIEEENWNESDSALCSRRETSTTDSSSTCSEESRFCVHAQHNSYKPYIPTEKDIQEALRKNMELLSSFITDDADTCIQFAGDIQDEC